MKKITIALTAMIFGTFLLSAQTATAPSGSGTSSDPYQIGTLDNLYWLSQTSTAWSKYSIQTMNINASSTSLWNSASGFSPIGNNTSKFTGFYNGKGHTITGLYINRSATSYVGLFGYTLGAYIDSLGLVGITISGNEYVGGIVGYNYSSTVSNCYSTGSITGLDSEVGGLVGYNYFSSTVKNCYSTGNVSGIHEVGGVVGYNYSNSTVTNCYSSNNVLGGAGYIGGVVGYNYSSTITNCYSIGSVSSSALANACVGGVIGVNSYSSTVTNCYSTGSVSGTGYIGGVLGWNSTSSSTITHCYWDTQASGTTIGFGINSGTFTCTGLSTTEMQSADFVTSLNANRGINFSWILVSGGYPVFGTSSYTGIENSCVSLLKLYPNPTTDNIIVDGIDGQATIIILDIDGRLLISKVVTSGQTISVNNLPNGIYLATIKLNNTMETEKLIIQR